MYIKITASHCGSDFPPVTRINGSEHGVGASKILAKRPANSDHRVYQDPGTRLSDISSRTRILMSANDQRTGRGVCGTLEPTRRTSGSWQTGHGDHRSKGLRYQGLS